MTTVQETKALPEGVTVNAVGGELTVLGPREDRIREDLTPYTLQHFTLADKTGAISGTIYDHYPLEQYDGMQIIMASQKSRNGRFGGVTLMKQQAAGSSLFAKKPAVQTLRVSGAAGVHTPDTYALLCSTTKRPEQKTISPTVGD